MEKQIDTKRLILRAIEQKDVEGMFKLDSDPLVHQYLGNNPITSLHEAAVNIDFIRQQYLTNGIGRWAVIEKDTQQFIGWAGLKLITDKINGQQNYYDLGYRFIPKYWGKGYATETGLATLGYGFEKLKLTKICAIADVNNLASKHVLEKLGFNFIGVFDYEGLPHAWLEINRDHSNY